MVHNRPMNAVQSTQNVRFRSHMKGMGTINELENNGPVLQVVNGGRRYGRTGVLYQGFSQASQYGGGIAGLGDDSTTTSTDLATQFPFVYGGGATTSNTFGDSVFEGLTSAGVDPNLANILSNPLVWVGGGLLLLTMMFSGGRRR